MVSSQPQEQAPRRNNHNPTLLTRDADGSVRVRLRLPEELAALIEEAAGQRPILPWMYAALADRARYQIRKRNEAAAAQGITPDNIYEFTESQP